MRSGRSVNLIGVSSSSGCWARKRGLFFIKAPEVSVLLSGIRITSVSHRQLSVIIVTVALSFPNPLCLLTQRGAVPCPHLSPLVYVRDNGAVGSKVSHVSDGAIDALFWSTPLVGEWCTISPGSRHRQLQTIWLLILKSHTDFELCHQITAKISVCWYNYKLYSFCRHQWTAQQWLQHNVFHLVIFGLLLQVEPILHTLWWALLFLRRTVFLDLDTSIIWGKVSHSSKIVYPSCVWAWTCQSSIFTSLASISTAFLLLHCR